MISDLELFAFVSGLIIVSAMLIIAFINIKVVFAEIRTLMEMKRVCTKHIIVLQRFNLSAK